MTDHERRAFLLAERRTLCSALRTAELTRAAAEAKITRLSAAVEEIQRELAAMDAEIQPAWVDRAGNQELD